MLNWSKSAEKVWKKSTVGQVLHQLLSDETFKKFGSD